MQARTIVLAVDDVRAVGIGSILSERLDAAQTVRELEIDVSVQGVRVKAWCGGSASTASRLTGAIRAIIASATDGKIYGLRKYRVTQMSADRVELQVVRRDAGLPDILPISMWPGLAGAHAALTPGAEVLVEFIDGEPTDPVITHFAGKGGAGFVPVSLAISVSSLLKLGDESATDFVALASKVDAAVNAIVDTVISPGDGGAAIKTAVTSAWSGVGSSSAATKVKAA
jgi:hypothetical protein